jgi:putative SOS response-associated peptidase YedK
MCGRYTLTFLPNRLAERFEAQPPTEDFFPRYNVSPQQYLPVICNTGERRIVMFRWGLIPGWAKNPSIGNRLINARAETVSEKPSFRTAFRNRRCLVLSDGFYEWQKTPSGKIPVRITLKDGEPFAFAGLWEKWRSPKGEEINTFSIITTEPNDLIAKIHHRMPVILRPEHEDVWLDNEAGAEKWLSVLKPYPAEKMTVYPVSRGVNSPRNDDLSLIEPVPPES